MKKNIANILIICISVFFGAMLVKYKRYFGGVSWNAVIISVCTPVISAVAIWILNRIRTPKVKGQPPQPVDERKQQAQILFLMYLMVAFYVAIRVFLAMAAK
jgi:cytosine/uracil/thiamine/allantoin permease